MSPNDGISAFLERRERKKFFSKLQAAAEAEGSIPPTPFLLLRATVKPLQYIGGFLLGVFLGFVTLFVNFLIFVWFLHWEL